MKLDMSKWKALSIKNRLKKGFRLTTFVASASGVIAGILMILVSIINEIFQRTNLLRIFTGRYRKGYGNLLRDTKRYTSSYRLYSF